MPNHVDRRMKVTVSGPPGAGKTNLIRAINRMLNGFPSDGLLGTVEFIGEEAHTDHSLTYYPSTGEPISVVIEALQEPAPTRAPAKTVADLIAVLRTMPPTSPVIGADLNPLHVTPQTTGAILIKDERRAS